jgi:hypothetical protein
LRAEARAGCKGPILGVDLCFVSSKDERIGPEIRPKQKRKSPAARTSNREGRRQPHFAKPAISPHSLDKIPPKWYALPEHPLRNPWLTKFHPSGVYLRRQLPRRETSLVIPQIILRPRTAGLHEAHGEIPHPQHSAHRRAGRQANRRPGRGIVANDAGARFEEAAARQYQAVEGYGNVQRKKTCDGITGQGTEDEDTGECFSAAVGVRKDLELVG